MNLNNRDICCVLSGAACIIVLLVIVYIANKSKKEGFSAAQRYQNAQRYALKPNALMPSDKRTAASNQIMLPLNIAGRGDLPMDYLLPNNGVKKEVAESPVVDAADAPPVIGGTETAEIPEQEQEASVSLNISTDDAVKSGANSIASVDIHDQTVPDTSDLPAIVQTGVVEDVDKEGFCGGNTRVCPTILKNGPFIVQHKLQKGPARDKEGFRVTRR